MMAGLKLQWLPYKWKAKLFVIYSSKPEKAAKQGHTGSCILRKGNSKLECRWRLAYGKQGRVNRFPASCELGIWTIQESSGLKEEGVTPICLASESLVVGCVVVTQEHESSTGKRLGCRLSKVPMNRNWDFLAKISKMTQDSICEIYCKMAAREQWVGLGRVCFRSRADGTCIHGCAAC